MLAGQHEGHRVGLLAKKLLSVPVFKDPQSKHTTTKKLLFSFSVVSLLLFVLKEDGLELHYNKLIRAQNLFCFYFSRKTSFFSPIKIHIKDLWMFLQP